MRRTMIFLIVLTLCYCARAEDALERTLARLEAKMAGLTTLDSGFIQKKRLAVFGSELELRGKVYLEKPDLFAWHVEKPMRYSMVMDGTAISQWDEDTGIVTKISLAGNPAFETVISQMRQWFDGRYQGLRTEYDVKLQSDVPAALEFIPRDGSMAAAFIEQVIVTFRDDERYIHSIEIREKSGDSTLLEFVDTAIGQPVPDNVWEPGR